MPDVDDALDELRRFADRPPRARLPVHEIAERAGRQRRRRRVAVASGALVVVAVMVAGLAWADARDDDAAGTVRAGPGSTTTTAPDARPASEPEPGDVAVWTTDPAAPPSATASSFTALVTRMRCSGGVTGRVLRPGVVVTDTEVVVRFTAEALGDGAFRCPGNDSVPYRVDIGQPIAGRTLVDGACRSDAQVQGSALCVEDAEGGVRWRPDSGPVVPAAMRGAGTPTPEAWRSALETGVMPGLTGVALNTLGDGTGVLFDLQDVIGQQRTTTVADDAPEGTVIAQDPPPGTPLDEVSGWSLTVSAGGPVVRVDDLPPDAAAFAAALPGFDRDEPLTMRTTDAGEVYKTDQWLFGLDCTAVDLAYRTFADARYGVACPGRIEGPGP